MVKRLKELPSEMAAVGRRLVIHGADLRVEWHGLKIGANSLSEACRETVVVTPTKAPRAAGVQLSDPDAVSKILF